MAGSLQVAVPAVAISSAMESTPTTALACLAEESASDPTTRESGDVAIRKKATTPEAAAPLGLTARALEQWARRRRRTAPFATPASVPWELDLVADDVCYVAGRFCELKAPGQAQQPNARLVFLGSTRVLDPQRGWWSKEKGGTAARRNCLRTYGANRAPQIVSTMVDMLARSTVESDVRAGLLAHRDYALPLLSGAEGEVAEAARALLSAGVAETAGPSVRAGSAPATR